MRRVVYDSETGIIRPLECGEIAPWMANCAEKIIDSVPRELIKITQIYHDIRFRLDRLERPNPEEICGCVTREVPLYSCFVPGEGPDVEQLEGMITIRWSDGDIAYFPPFGNGFLLSDSGAITDHKDPQTLEEFKSLTGFVLDTICPYKEYYYLTSLLYPLEFFESAKSRSDLLGSFQGFVTYPSDSAQSSVTDIGLYSYRSFQTFEYSYGSEDAVSGVTDMGSYHFYEIREVAYGPFKDTAKSQVTEMSQYHFHEIIEVIYDNWPSENVISSCDFISGEST